jgi:hypothetical protein
MLDKISAFYPAIGNAIAAGLPTGWQKVWVYVEILPGRTSVAAYYTKEDPAKLEYIRLPRQVFRLFEQLHQGSRADPQTAWTNVTFIMMNTGKFSVEYGYEPVPVEGEVERRRTWERKYLASSSTPG